MTTVRIGIIGCGAITEQQYFPILKESSLFNVCALVDKDLERAKNLAGGTISVVTRDYLDIVGHVDAVIIAVPNFLHALMAKDLLAKGIHVLVEKPMAMTVRDCDDMINISTQNNCVLAVGHSKRFFHAHRFVKNVIDQGLLGTIQSFDFRDGTVFSWPAASDFLFRKETGGGVLADTGPHTLDLLLWWLGDYEHVDYYDDAMGGVEADCELYIKLKNGASGIVELSRTRNLRKTYQIIGTKATLEVGANWANPPVVLKINGQEAALKGTMLDMEHPQKEYVEVMRQQLEEFANAIWERRLPFVNGAEGRKSIQLIEECYRDRKLLRKPWLQGERKELVHV